MTPLEKTILNSLATVTIHMTEIGKLQIDMANKLAQNLPNLPEAEKSELLAIAEKSWLQVQSLQETAKKIQEVLE